VAHKKIIKTIVVLFIFLLFLWASSNLVYNLKNVDRDEDQLNDETEALIGTDSLDPDTDNDGMDDFNEFCYWMERSEENISSEFYDFWADYWNETFGITLTYELIKANLLPIGDIDHDNLSNICDIDSDNDERFDYNEILDNSDPALPDEGNSSNINPNPNPNNGGGGGGGADDLSKTETHISSIFPEDIDKKDSFYVEGYVIGVNQTDLYNLTIEIFINKTKDSNGSFAGSGNVDINGYYNISCIVSDDVEPGSNHIVAHFLGDDENAGSWSDPIVNIYSDTKLELDMLDYVGMNYSFEIKGLLTDPTDLPLNNKTIKIYWEESYIGSTLTNTEGEFILNYTYDELGSYKVDALFEEEEYLNSSNDSKIISVKDFGAYLDVFLSEQTIKREEILTIQATLFSSLDIPIQNAEIKIYYDLEEVSTKTTDSNGTLEEKITIPAESPLGQVVIRLFFIGSDLYGGTNFEEYVTIQSDTFLLFDSLEKETYEINETILISGTLTDNYNEPIKNASIIIFLDENDTFFNTDDRGRFELNYKLTNNLSYGVHYINAIFPGLGYYLSSQDSTSFEIIEEGLLNNNILIIIIIVTLLGIGGVILSLFKKQQEIKRDNISLKEVALKSIDKLRNEEDFRKAILECYSDMCKWLDESGLKKDVDKTPREFASDIKKGLNVSDECLISLTKIFEKACYSDYQIDVQERDKTIECLDEILTNLTDNIRTSEVEE